jgi:ABC-2 type transport system ATP-binding protein
VREPADAEAMVLIEGLAKSFGKTQALSGLDLRIAPGTVCAMLGPNGAGKTTAVRILATLVKPDAGLARVAGYDVVRDPAQVRYRIGLAGQHAAIDGKLTGRDNLRMFGRLYHLGDRAAMHRANELLDRFGFADVAGRLAETYSGGMRRRLDVVASLIMAPPVLFLDEPTTGLDPGSRVQIWASIRELVADGTTVLLTTQYLDEADHLADRIAVVDNGRVVASGTPDELPAAAAVLERIACASPAVEPERRKVSVAVSGGSLMLTRVLRELDQADVAAEDVALRRPTLDEVFLRLTERSAFNGTGAMT